VFVEVVDTAELRFELIACSLASCFTRFELGELEWMFLIASDPFGMKDSL
jgi:hypothetical protein